MGRTQASSMILNNGNGEILLQHRDDKPEIWMPNKWGTFGGGLKLGESPLEALIREIRAEIEYKIKEGTSNYFTSKNFIYLGGGVVTVSFYSILDPSVRLEDLRLNEGRNFGFWSYDDLKEMDLIPGEREVFEMYFQSIR